MQLSVLLAYNVFAATFRKATTDPLTLNFLDCKTYVNERSREHKNGDGSPPQSPHPAPRCLPDLVQKKTVRVCCLQELLEHVIVIQFWLRRSIVVYRLSPQLADLNKDTGWILHVDVQRIRLRDQKKLTGQNAKWLKCVHS